jgi:hypothetical protein
MNAPRHTRSYLIGSALFTLWTACVVVGAFAGVVIAFAAAVAVLR